MNVVEVLIVLAISFLIIAFFVPILWIKTETLVQPILFKIKTIQMIERTSKNGLLMIENNGKIVFYDPRKNRSIEYSFPFEIYPEGPVAGKNITFKNGFVSISGTVYGGGWRVTIEPVTGRMRIYRRR
ncbi:hypothetical protein [Thermotoga sp. KOL6]|uniref:hypothetical protein n=1 Tax=Thermotoga sp. KOL6 TaxID=126741 RepID=UPI000C76B125|nr:hypothetical protein [Thermotoga sp. KOL6]PLV58691.1 hypothetical protein AS005_07335 [Thermotoga sp. KOL6]